MNTYMVTILLPKELTKEFISLIPEQRARIEELMDQGKVLQYALAIDRSTLWVTISAKSETVAKAIIATFPLIYYMKPRFIELAYQSSISTELPKIMMN